MSYLSDNCFRHSIIAFAFAITQCYLIHLSCKLFDFLFIPLKYFEVRSSLMIEICFFLFSNLNWEFVQLNSIWVFDVSQWFPIHYWFQNHSSYIAHCYYFDLYYFLLDSNLLNFIVNLKNWVLLFFSSLLDLLACACYYIFHHPAPFLWSYFIR